MNVARPGGAVPRVPRDSAGAGSMSVSVLPRPMHSRGRPKGLTDASEPGAAPSPPARSDQLTGDRHGAAVAHYRRGEVGRLCGDQARPDGAVPRMPRGRPTGWGEP